MLQEVPGASFYGKNRVNAPLGNNLFASLALELFAHGLNFVGCTFQGTVFFVEEGVCNGEIFLCDKSHDVVS